MSTLGQKAIGFFQLIRLHTCIQGAGIMLLGAYLSARPGEIFTASTLNAAAVVILVMAASFAFNDWFDAGVDQINHRGRAVPSGRITRFEALLTAIVCAAAALFAALPLGGGLLILAALNLSISAAYTLVLKGTLLVGNVSIAALNSSLLLYGALAAGAMNARIWAPAGIVFLFTIGQEVLYNLIDAPADDEGGIRTTAVRLGRTRTRALFFAVSGVLLIFAVLVSGQSPRPGWYLGTWFLALLVPYAVIVPLLRFPFTRARLYRACHLVTVSRLLSIGLLILL